MVDDSDDDDDERAITEKNDCVVVALTTTSSEKSENDNDNNACRITILALYQFVSPRMDKFTVKQYQQEIETFLRMHNAKGAILLSPEGINGTICYPKQQQQQQQQDDVVFDFLTKRFPGLKTRLSYHNTPVFFRLRVRIKPEIVSMGIPTSIYQDDGDVDNDDESSALLFVQPTKRVGEYVSPQDWDELIADPDCLVIDTRNEYEIKVGTFPNAVSPHTTSFTEFPTWLQQTLRDNHKKKEKPFSKVAMFCTGGIRCEKATSYCLNLVKDEMPVYHLQGGILAYLDTVPPETSTFQGECYVFDQRIAVTHGLQPSQIYEACHACRHPLTPQDHNVDFVPGIVCPYCKNDSDREARRDRYKARHLHLQVAAKKGILHLHDGKQAQQQQQVPFSRRGIPMEQPDDGEGRVYH